MDIEAVVRTLNERIKMVVVRPSRNERAQQVLDILDFLSVECQNALKQGSCMYRGQQREIRGVHNFAKLVYDATEDNIRPLLVSTGVGERGTHVGLLASPEATYDLRHLLLDAYALLWNDPQNRFENSDSTETIITTPTKIYEFQFTPKGPALYQKIPD